MSKVIRWIFEFIFSEKLFLTGVGVVWAVAVLEIIFKLSPILLHDIQKWIIFVAGCAILLVGLFGAVGFDPHGGGKGGRPTGEA